MNFGKKAAAFALGLLMAAGLLAACAQANEADSQVQAAEVNSSQLSTKDEDYETGWDDSATFVLFSGQTASVDGNGAAWDGSTLTISQAGVYVLSGSLDNGQVLVNAPESAVVRIVLNGVQIYNSSSAPINAQQADKLVVTLAEGTENTLSDGESYVFPDDQTDEPSATLFSKVDLTINGEGLLVVNAAYNNGIGTKDDLLIVSGNIQVTAANHAIRGRDSVTILDGALELTAGNDGIQSNNDSGEEGKGQIDIYGGTIQITSGHDGIQAETNLAIYGGSMNITAGGGYNSAYTAENTDSGGGTGGWGGQGGGTMPEGGFNGEMQPPEGMEMPEGFPENLPEDWQMPDGAAMPEGGFPGGEAESDTQAADSSQLISTSETTQEAAAEDETGSDSYKAIKAGGSLLISGGSLVLNSADDAVHANVDVTITGGSLQISTGDDGVHADNSLIIEGEPVINITQSYEGLEAAYVTINGGQIDIVASDDGINAAGGADSSSTGRQQDSFSSASGDYIIAINGGEIHIAAGADGLDSNMDIEINGGTLVIDMTNYNSIGGDGAIDRDGNLTVTGGTILAAGGNGMVTMGRGGSTESSSAAQPVGEVYFSQVMAAGTLLEVKNGAGETLLSHTTQYDFRSFTFTGAGLASGETYTLYANGEKVVDISLSGAVTSIQDTGEAASASSGMGGGRGGTRPQG